MTPEPPNGFGVFSFDLFFGGEKGEFAGGFAIFGVQNVVFVW
jgi:hypothetical protein